MPVQVTVLYPKTADYHFDEEYYLKKHMPLVQEKWAPYGLRSWRISRLAHPDPSKEEPYRIQADLVFDSREDVDAALKNAASEVLGDVPNFTNTKPDLLIGAIIGFEQVEELKNKGEPTSQHYQGNAA